MRGSTSGSTLSVARLRSSVLLRRNSIASLMSGTVDTSYRIIYSVFHFYGNKINK